MDTSNPYNAPPEARYSMPSQLPPDRGDSPYNVPTPAPQQQKSVFEQYPFHSYLEDHAANTLKKKPYDLSDDEIKGALGNYLDTVLSNQLSNEKGFANEAHFQKALDARKSYYGPLARARLEQDMPNLRAYLNGLKPKGKPGEAAQQPQDQQEGLFSNIGRQVAALPADIVGAGSILLGGAARAGNMLNPQYQAVPQQVQDANTKDWEDFFFGGADKAFDVAKKIKGTPAGDIGSRVGATLGSLPEAISTAGMSSTIENARDKIQKGEDLSKVKQELAIDSAVNILAGKLPSGNVLARASKGAVYNPILENARALLEGKELPGGVDNFLSAVFGAGFGAALGKRTGNAKGKSEEVPPAGEGQGPASEAGKPTNEGGAPVTPNNVALNAKTKAKLSSLDEDIVDAETPEAARALWAKHVGDIEESQRQAAQNAFAEDWAATHDRKPEELNAPSNEEKDLAAAAAGTPDATKGPPVPPSEPPKPPETAPQGAQTPEKTASGAAPEPVDPELQHREEPDLPRDLRGSKPRFGSTQLNFASDFDKALYIIGKSDTLSKRDLDFMQFIKQLHPNMPNWQIRQLGQLTREHVKNAVRNSDNEVVDVPNSGSWDRLEQGRIGSVVDARAAETQRQTELARIRAKQAANAPVEASTAETPKPNPLAKAKPIASMFTREHLADAEKYHAEQDISKKGAIKKKIMDEAGLPKKDVEAFLDALKPKAVAPENPLAPKAKRR